jgi:hypothetical protein
VNGVDEKKVLPPVALHIKPEDSLPESFGHVL